MVEYCGGVLWGFDWTRRKITALPFSVLINGSCDRVDVADIVGTSADAEAWTRSIEGYNALRALGWSKPVLCNISYYKALDVCLAQDQCTGGQFMDCAFQNSDGSFTECPSVMTHQCVNGVLVATGRECVDCRQPEPTCEPVEVVCEDGSVIVTQECIGGVLTPTGRTCPPPYVCSPVEIECEDGSRVMTQECIDNVLTPTGNTCPAGCTPETYVCGDGYVIVTKQCENGELVPTGAECPSGEKPGSPLLLVGIAAAVALVAGGAFIVMKRK